MADMNKAQIDLTDQRLAPLLGVAKQQALDAIALVPGANFRRIFGHDFHQNERPLVLVLTAGGEMAAVVPELEMGSFSEIGFKGEAFPWRDQTGYGAAFQALGQKLADTAGPIGRLGVEGQRMRVFEMKALQAAIPSAEIIDCQLPIARLRLTKTTDEIDRLRHAIAISERALEATLAEVRVGQSEAEVEAILLRHLFSNGADGLAFTPIVVAGAYSANPHARARADYRLQEGDALLLDFGASYRGMLADITRTVFVRQVSERHRTIYDTVLAANAAGRKVTRAGLTAHDVDDAVQSVLEASPFAAMILTKTGHGLGLDVHEDPYIMRGNTMVLETGMVFTIEPSLKGRGELGVRIEDDVVVTEDGCISLTSFPRELRLVG